MMEKDYDYLIGSDARCQSEYFDVFSNGYQAARTLPNHLDTDNL